MHYRVCGAALVGALVFCAHGSESSAQSAPSSDYPAERFRLAATGAGILDVESAVVSPHLDIDMALWLGFADDPLNLYDSTEEGRSRVASLVSSRLAGGLVASIGLYDRFQLGLSVPLILSQGQDLGDMDSLETGSNFGLGDLRLMPKAQLVKQAEAGVDIAIQLGFTLPTGRSADFMGDTGAVFQPEVVVGRRFGPKLRGAINLGYRARGRTEALNLVVDDEVFAHAGVGYSPLDDTPLELDLTFASATGASDIFGQFNRNYAELKLGGSYDIEGPLTVFSALGVGAAEGFGTPDWRAIVGVRAVRAHAKPDVALVAKTTPQDSDNDGLMDDEDSCPLEPETKNDYRDADGCPDELPDTDGDGFIDMEDGCPNEAEDKDEFEDHNGCPDLDDDSDGILDVDDECRLEAGPASNRGCPEPDRDGDTVADTVDNCPDEPGTIENQGCKDRQLVVIEDGKLDLLQKVYFRTNKAIIRPKSFELLNNVADVLKAHTQIAKVQVEGHTDDRGRDTYNKKLSQRRAEAVVAYLNKRGVQANRLEAVGYGEAKPIATNDTDEGRATNRRVQLTIVGDAGDDIENVDAGPTEDTID